MMVHVKIEKLLLSNIGAAVVLKGYDDPRVIPIVIGTAEAQAIAFSINRVDVPRPLTHDLFKNVMDCLECRLMRVEICDLKDGTFYANLVCDQDGMEMEIDSRPSDAIALALRTETPIYVDEKVMSQASRFLVDQSPDAEGIDDIPLEEDHNHHLSPLEELNHNLSKAIADERYEEAAKLRDQIEEFRKHHSKN